MKNIRLVVSLAIGLFLVACNSSNTKTEQENSLNIDESLVNVDSAKTEQTIFDAQKKDLSTTVYPNNEEGARKIAEDLNKDDDNAHKLYKSLFPSELDFSYIVTNEEDRIALNEYTYPSYRRGLYMKGKEGETVVILHKLTSKDIESGNFGSFNEGYAHFAPILREDITFYAFEFVKEGEEKGSRFESLVYVNNKWIFTPMPYKAFE